VANLKIAFEGAVEDGGEQGVELRLGLCLGFLDGRDVSLEAIEPELAFVSGYRDGDFFQFRQS